MKKTPGRSCVRQARGRYAVVVSRFNEFVTRRLLAGALEELAACGVKKKDVVVLWVPGAFEIPVAALKLARKKNIDGVVALGAVIRGQTYHFELVARAAAEGIAHVALVTGKPVGFGILATETVSQAQARATLRGDNKGREAARAVMEIVEAFRKI